MGPMQSAIADDEWNWEHLQKLAKLPNTSWKVYSVEAGHASEGYRKHKLQGEKLIEYVGLALLIDKLKVKQSEEDKEKKELARLKAKYE